MCVLFIELELVVSCWFRIVIQACLNISRETANTRKSYFEMQPDIKQPTSVQLTQSNSKYMYMDYVDPFQL